jgi:hypothetical protein
LKLEACTKKVLVITGIPLLGTANRIAKKMIILIRETKLQSSKEAAKTQMSQIKRNHYGQACNCYATMLNRGNKQTKTNDINPTE